VKNRNFTHVANDYSHRCNLKVSTLVQNIGNGAPLTLKRVLTEYNKDLIFYWKTYITFNTSSSVKLMFIKQFSRNWVNNYFCFL